METVRTDTAKIAMKDSSTDVALDFIIMTAGPLRRGLYSHTMNPVLK